MPEFVRKDKNQQRNHQEQQTDAAAAKELAEADAAKHAEIRAKAEETISDLDDLLDEIDAVLEENAEEFVKAYQQKGGE